MRTTQQVINDLKLLLDSPSVVEHLGVSVRLGEGFQLILYVKQDGTLGDAKFSITGTQKSGDRRGPVTRL